MGIGIRPSTMRRYKGHIQKKPMQVRQIQILTETKPFLNIQKPNEESILTRRLLKKELELKALKDLEWILTEVLENKQIKKRKKKK